MKLQEATGYLRLLDVYHKENYVQRIIHSKTGRMSQCVCHALGKVRKGTLMVSQSHATKSPARKMVCHDDGQNENIPCGMCYVQGVPTDAGQRSKSLVAS